MSKYLKYMTFILFVVLLGQFNLSHAESTKPWYKIKKIEELRIFIFFPDYDLKINSVYFFHLKLMATYMNIDPELNVYIYKGSDERSQLRANIIKKYLLEKHKVPTERLYVILDKTKEQGFALDGERIEIFMTRSKLFEMIQAKRSGDPSLQDSEQNSQSTGDLSSSDELVSNRGFENENNQNEDVNSKEQNTIQPKTETMGLAGGADVVPAENNINPDPSLIEGQGQQNNINGGSGSVSGLVNGGGSSSSAGGSGFTEGFGNGSGAGGGNGSGSGNNGGGSGNSNGGGNGSGSGQGFINGNGSGYGGTINNGNGQGNAFSGSAQNSTGGNFSNNGQNQNQNDGNSNNNTEGFTPGALIQNTTENQGASSYGTETKVEEPVLKRKNIQLQLGLATRLSKFSTTEDSWGAGLDFKLSFNNKKKLRFVLTGVMHFIDDIDWKPETKISFGFESVFETAEVSTQIFYKQNYALNTASQNFQDYEDIGLGQSVMFKLLRSRGSVYKLGVFGEFSFSNNLPSLANSNVIVYGIKSEMLLSEKISLLLIYEKRKLREQVNFEDSSDHYGVNLLYNF